MKPNNRWLQRQTVQTPPLEIGEQTIVLESTAFSTRWPYGGGVWHRPTAVLIRENSLSTRLPIPDPTRQALWTFSGMTLLTSIIIFLFFRQR